MFAPESSGTSPATLWPLITGYMPARVVHVAAELGIADLLATEAKTTDVLAQEIDTAPVPLRRLLRALASFGLVEEREFRAGISRLVRGRRSLAGTNRLIARIGNQRDRGEARVSTSGCKAWTPRGAVISKRA